MHEGSTNPRLKQELCSATDLALRAREVAAQSLGKAMSTFAVQERRLLAQPCWEERSRQSKLSRRSRLPGLTVRRHCRGLCPAVLGSTEADRGNTSCPGVMHRSAVEQDPVCLSPWAPSCVSRAAPPRADRRPARRASRRARRPLCPAGPDIVQIGDKAALTQATLRCGKLAWSQEMARTAPLLPPEGGQGENHSFCSAAGSRASGTHIVKERAIPFPPSFQPRGLTVCNALPPHSRPRPILPVAKRVRLGDGRPPHAPLASQSLQGLREFCEDESERRAFCTIQPYSHSLHHCGYVDCAVGATCTASGGVACAAQPVSLAHAHNSTRLRDSVRQATSQVQRRSRDCGGSSECSCLARGDCCPPGKDAIEPVPPAERQGFYSPYFIVPKKDGGLRPILDCDSWTGPCTGSRLRCWRTGAWSNAYSPGIGLQRSTWRMLTFMFRSFATQTVPTVCVRGSGMAVQGPPLRALPVPRVFTKIAEGALAPLREVGIRILNCLEHGPRARTVVRSQGPGASAPQPVGASGQLGKEQALPCAENLFSWCGVDSVSMTGASRKSAPNQCWTAWVPSEAGLWSAETVSEAPGAYGIRSCSHAARIASYETTSALVALPSPEVGMAPRCTSGEHHTGVSPLLQPLDGPCLSTGRGALRTSVSACCCHNRCLQHGLGRYMQRAGSLGALDGASTALAHQLPRAAGSASSLAAVSATAVRQACVGPYGQHCGCVVHQPDGGYTITPHVTARPPSPPLESHAAQIAARCPYSGGAQSCGRCALTTAHFPRRMATPSRDDPADLESIRGAQVDLFASRESSHCQLYFSLTEGTLGTDALAHSWPRALCKYAFPPVSLLAQTLCKVREDEEQVLLVAPFWPTRTWFPELILLATAPPWPIPLRKDLLSQGLGTIWHPRPDLWNLHVWLLDGTRQTWVVSHRRW